jgi:hypothetical protein
VGPPKKEFNRSEIPKGGHTRATPLRGSHKEGLARASPKGVTTRGALNWCPPMGIPQGCSTKGVSQRGFTKAGLEGCFPNEVHPWGAPSWVPQRVSEAGP